jgi:hypothetical protein
MSLWQLGAAVDGYLDAHVPSESPSAGSSDAEDVWAWMQTKSDKVVVN